MTSTSTIREPQATVATPRPRIRPAHVGLAASGIVAVTLVLAAVDTEGQTLLLATVFPLAALVGIVTGALYGRNLRSMFWGTVIGLGIGISQSLKLYGWNIIGSFALTVATLSLMGFIGFMIGSFVEFVQLLHFVAHGGKVGEYRRN